jgi:thymidylate synthase (FAD)
MPKIVKARVLDVIGLQDPAGVLNRIEHCGRVSYMSWDKEAPGSAEKFVQMIVRLGHESVLEHALVTAIIECDRATAQQFTRHRLASFTMQSQRYCNYSGDRFGHEVAFVDPEFKHSEKESAMKLWLEHMAGCEDAYMKLLKGGCSPEDARSVLPNSAACVIVITANLREWRHIFNIRTEVHAQHNIRRLCTELLKDFAVKVPCVFADIVQTLV